MDNLKDKIKQLKYKRLTKIEKYIYNIFIDIHVIVIDNNNFILYKKDNIVLFKYEKLCNIFWCNVKIVKQYDVNYDLLILTDYFPYYLKNYIKTYLHLNNVRIIFLPNSIINENI